MSEQGKVAIFPLLLSCKQPLLEEVYRPGLAVSGYEFQDQTILLYQALSQMLRHNRNIRQAYFFFQHTCVRTVPLFIAFS